MDQFIYLFKWGLAQCHDRWQHLAGWETEACNTGGLIRPAGRHPLCASCLKWWCCSLLKHHLPNNFGTDRLSCLLARGRDHLLWFWREEGKPPGSHNLLSLQSMCSLILKSFQSSERVQRKHVSALKRAEIPLSISSPSPKFSTIIFPPPNWYSVWLC